MLMLGTHKALKLVVQENQRKLSQGLPVQTRNPFAAMSERKTYLRIREVELSPSKGGRQQYAELRFNPAQGKVTECCVGYKIWFEGEYAEIVRYDSHSGADFHRHEAGYPEPGAECESFTDVPMNKRGSFAVDHITKNCEPWQNVLPTLTREEDQRT